MAPAFVVRLLPHPDRSAMDEKEIERSARSHDTGNRHRPSMRVNRANEECCELSDIKRNGLMKTHYFLLSSFVEFC